ncbi:hypothetical protein [Roseospira goensis]|uniref:Uncharacterized protein n=1 Tax=Roseospira goensis TaxID=391922 RepID=A0A7W6S191_9PROT|nr:hypothetical protein [Roseospira goensis]MBB4286525.1 hypothetical protein [Roseospira goensis]
MKISTMSLATGGAAADAAAGGPQEVRVDLNDRCFLFPAGKGLSHVSVTADRDSGVELRAVFAFNQSRTDSTIDAFTLDEARDLARSMVEAIYQARTQTVFLDGRRLALVCHSNGFVMVGHDDAYELFISGQLMINVAQAILRAVDKVAPVEAH